MVKCSDNLQSIGVGAHPLEAPRKCMVGVVVNAAAAHKVYDELSREGGGPWSSSINGCPTPASNFSSFFTQGKLLSWGLMMSNPEPSDTSQPPVKYETFLIHNSWNFLVLT